MKNVIVAIWHNTGSVEVFSSLRGFLEKHPEYNEHTLNNYISRKKVPFVVEELSLLKTKFIKRNTDSENEAIEEEKLSNSKNKRVKENQI